MGMTFSQFDFSYPAPSVQKIADTLAEKSELEVSTENFTFDDGIHQWSADLGFALSSRTTTRIFTYPKGYHAKVSKPTLGWDEEESVQRVYLQGYIGQDMTFFEALESTLQHLGGVYSGPIESYVEDLEPINAEQLKLQIKENRRKNRVSQLLLLPLLPIIILLYIVIFLLMGIILIILSPILWIVGGIIGLKTMSDRR